MAKEKERSIGRFVKENKTWFAIGVPGAAAGLGALLLIRHLQNKTKDPTAKEVLGNTANDILKGLNPSLGSNAVHEVAESAAQDIKTEIKGKEKKQIVKHIDRIAKVLQVPEGLKTLQEKITYIALVTGEKIREVWEKEKDTK